MANNDYTSQPWASGPAEILEHGLELLAIKDSDKNRRLAIISIDNAVELMIKTYLNLPRRITGIGISRKEYADFSESFPKLLDALEKHAESKLEGVELGEVEWYHRLRNELYHQGNGLTVERRKVEVYAELAKILFKNLYGIDLIPNDKHADDPLAMFLKAWGELLRRLHGFAREKGVFASIQQPHKYITGLHDLNEITSSEVEDITQLRNIRNKLVHGQLDIESTLTNEVVEKLDKLVNKFPAV